MVPELTPEFCLSLYRHGMFPMADGVDGEIAIYQPRTRAILRFPDLKISRSLRRTLRDPLWEVRYDTCFDEVMMQCAAREETWISEEIRRVYGALHRRGHAHSVEVYRHSELVGGLYGVSLGAVFFGESMFHRCRDASKVAFVALVRRLEERGYAFLEMQYRTDHLVSLGATMISHEQYLRELSLALPRECRFP